MISNTELIVAAAAIIFAVIFAFVCVRYRRVQLLHKLYFCTVVIMIVWLTTIIAMRFLDTKNMDTLHVLDVLMQVGGFTPPLILLISAAFARGIEKLPKAAYLLLIMPVLTIIMDWTNPLHHLYYEHFSMVRSEIVFGPYIVINGIYSYICFLISIIMLIAFAVKRKNRLSARQSLFFIIGALVPAMVSLLATLGVIEMSIAATPLSYVFTLVFHGIAIFQFHMLDIRPIARQRVLDWIADSYLILNEKRLIIDFNRHFYDIIGKQYGMCEGAPLSGCNPGHDENRSVMRALTASLDSCEKTGGHTSYEQAIFVKNGERYKKCYYMVEITPLDAKNGNIIGFVIFFKDVTSIKENMQRLADSQVRMMEQERLASLGQMIGGIAHNLKTPIMSISGGTVALDDLISEGRESVGDDEVTDDDFREIFKEMSEWTERTRLSCAYMSDIITAVKGQATNMNTSDNGDFTVEQLVKHVMLLLRHELQSSGCRLESVDETGKEIHISGDINNLVQVVNNLVSNAVDAMKPGGGDIEIKTSSLPEGLGITVTDSGPGVSPEVAERLFRQMVTSKGAKGTGLGLFISNTVIKAKFGGEITLEKSEKGAAFRVLIANEYITLKERKEEAE